MMMLAAMAAAILASRDVAATEPPSSHPVIELRQYRIVSHRRDDFIALFEREFVETQEAVGMRLVAQFRDRGDPDRFTWIRAFPSMAARRASLESFYLGPVWRAHRAAANPMLDDNDNVLLLRPATPGLAFATAGARGKPGEAAPAAGVVVATIYYLWKAPDEGFTGFFADRLAPALRRAGLAPLAAYVPEEQANDFTRLPVRQGEKLLVWFARADSDAAYRAAIRRLERDAEWPALKRALDNYEERDPQRLILDPTPRSQLR